MALNNYYDYLKEKPIYYRVIICSVLFLVTLNFFMNVWGYKKVAIYKSKDLNNIIEGCAYYGKEYNDKYNRNNILLLINGKLYSRDEIFLKKFPANYNQKLFLEKVRSNKNECHKLKYVDVNLFFIRKIFIYDYID